MKLSSVSRFAASLLIVGALACGETAAGSDLGHFEADREVSAEALAADDDSEASGAGESRGEQRLGVSDAGAQLGLDHWKFQGGGIYGVAGDGEVLAEFHIRSDNLAVESTLPERSVRYIDGSADFTPITKSYYDALALDIRFLSNSADPVTLPSDVEKIVVNCFLILDNCLAEAAQRRVLFGQNCTCSLNVAACGIILPIALDC